MIPSWLMLARSPVEEQLRPIGGGVEGRRGGEVGGWGSAGARLRRSAGLELAILRQAATAGEVHA